MASKRKREVKTIPSIGESFLGIATDQNLKGANPKKRKGKSRGIDPQETAKDKVPLRGKKRATSDSILMHNSERDKITLNVSNIKIDAFDFFQQMLNDCCGSQVFDVFSTASILKQFTPEVMKTVIYVLAESSKRVSPKVLTEAQTQTLEKVEENQDLEISSITSKARQKRGRNKWQPVPELVQPRLTSPVSNSCSPVSAAVQALMSFARNEDQVRSKVEIAPTETKRQQATGDVECAEKVKRENLNVFESTSLSSVSNSPFLQPMSSSLMLHAEVKEPNAFQEKVPNDKDRKSTNDSPQNTTLAFGRSTSPSFPWIRTPNKTEHLVKSDNSKSAERYLPSISSILAPIGSSLSDLSFQNMLSASTNSYPSSATSSATDPQKNALPPLGLIISGLNSQSHVQHKLSDLSVLSSPSPGLMETRKPSSSSSPLGVSTSSLDGAAADCTLKVSPKTVFRKILPKPNLKKVTDESTVQYQNIITDTQSSIKEEQDFLLEKSASDINTDLKLQSEIGFLLPDSPLVHEGLRKGASSLHQDADGDSPLGNFDKDSSDGSSILAKPLAGVISNMRQQGFVIKGLPHEQPSSSIPSKSKNPSHPNSGKLEVASALLSMGSTENETKASNKVVSTFNKEKATFDIMESSSVQHSDILFTKTGTFQIEDIEIDPKKNKIEKDSYECGKCGRVFTSLVYLARHIKRVCPDMTLRKWKCERCDKAFRHPFGLQQHIFTHTGERPFKCDQCSKAFYSANDLRRHARTHSGERPYSCSHCKKCFSTTISLKTHTYIHTGERPHKCPHCPKTFATSSKLSRHVVTHSDKRPFACSICVKTFNRSGDLRRHYNNVHNLEHGLLSCDQCNKLFATQKCLDNHKSTHNRSMKLSGASEGFQQTGDVKFAAFMPVTR